MTGVETAEGPPLPPMPALGRAGQALSRASRVSFHHGNRWLMVPLHRAGLAAWLGNPVTGWQALLTTTGRRTGLARETPLAYTIVDGEAWVMAGYGPGTHWFANLRADSRCTLRLPARRPFAAIGRECRDRDVRRRVIPILVRSMWLPGLLVGADPRNASDEQLLELTRWAPLVRLVPEAGPLRPGPDDPGGRGWVWRQAVLAAVMVALVILLARRRSSG